MTIASMIDAYKNHAESMQIQWRLDNIALETGALQYYAAKEPALMKAKLHQLEHIIERLVTIFNELNAGETSHDNDSGS